MVDYLKQGRSLEDDSTMSDTDEEAVSQLAEQPRHGRERSPDLIAVANRRMVERQQDYRHAADIAAKALIPFKEIQAVAVFGTVAIPLGKEISGTSRDRHNEVALWHECQGIDLAVWLDRFHQLSAMRTAINRALTLNRGPGKKVVLEEVAVHLFEHGTDRYVGTLCHYQKCPADKPACRVPGCGAVGHLRQFRDYRFDHDNLSDARCARLFDRASATVNRAVDLPGPQEEQASGGA